jgi:superkiller protein 3
LETTLAISLVHFNPPIHHIRALRLLDSLLANSPNDYRCLLAKGHIFSLDGRFEAGCDLFTRVFDAPPNDTENNNDENMRLEARVERVWCLGNIDGRTQEALQEMHEVAAMLDEDPAVDRSVKAKNWWRYGHLLSKMQSKL